MYNLPYDLLNMVTKRIWKVEKFENIDFGLQHICC